MSYPAAILEAGARALAARTGVLGDYDALDASYRRDLQLDTAAVLDVCLAPHLAGQLADELEKRMRDQLEGFLYPEGERCAAAVHDGFPGGRS